MPENVLVRLKIVVAEGLELKAVTFRRLSRQKIFY